MLYHNNYTYKAVSLNRILYKYLVESKKITQIENHFWITKMAAIIMTYTDREKEIVLSLIFIVIRSLRFDFYLNPVVADYNSIIYIKFSKLFRNFNFEGFFL